jgi:hypothetical protein
MKRAFLASLTALALIVFVGFTPRRILINERFTIFGPPPEVLLHVHRQLVIHGAKLLSSTSSEAQQYGLPFRQTRITVAVTADEMTLSGTATLAPGCSRADTQKEIDQFIDTVIDEANRSGDPQISIKKQNEPNKAMETTPVNVTIPADAGLAPFTSVSHL